MWMAREGVFPGKGFTWEGMTASKEMRPQGSGNCRVLHLTDNLRDLGHGILPRASRRLEPSPADTLILAHGPAEPLCA